MAINNIDIQDDKGNSYRPMANPDSVIEFTKAGSRTNIASGDTHRTVWGKICKFFADLGTAAFCGLANNLSTTAAGYGIDARQGPVIQAQFNQINSDLAGYKFGKTTDGQPGYIAPGGADTVIPFKSHTIFDASVSVGSSDASSVTVPLINYYPNYSKITAANIFVKYKSGTLMGYAKTGGSSISSVLGLSYNNSTGNLTISNAGNNTAGGFYYYRGSTQVFTICIVP